MLSSGPVGEKEPKKVAAVHPVVKSVAGPSAPVAKCLEKLILPGRHSSRLFVCCEPRLIYQCRVDQYRNNSPRPDLSLDWQESTDSTGWDIGQLCGVGPCLGSVSTKLAVDHQALDRQGLLAELQRHASASP